MQRLTAVLVVGAVGLAACGGGQGGAGAASTGSRSGPVTSASASRALIVVAEEPATGYQNSPTTVRLMRPDGTVAGRLTVKQGANVVRAGGGRIFVVENDGALKAIHPDGSVENLGSVGSGQPNGFAVSPDGTHWMWSTWDTNGVSQVHIAGDGMSQRVVAQMQSRDQSVHAYSWTGGGAFIDHKPNGIGGYILFDASFGEVDRLDPNNFTTTPLRSGSCQFSDKSRDGTVACFPGSGDPNSRSISIIKNDGSSKTIQLAMPRFAQDGDAFFSRDGQRLSVAGAANAGTNNQPERYGTDVITTIDASIQRLAIDGVRASDEMQGQAWLDDGSLVVWRPDNAAGAPPAVYLVGPAGKVTQLGGRGTPIGVITG